jgi:ketosteroid isomerase-like protein
VSEASNSPASALLDHVRPSIDAWNTGDLESAIELIDPEIEWRTARVFPDISPVYRGLAEVRKFWATFVEPWEDIRLEVEEVLHERGTPDDGLVVIRARFRARGREGIELDLVVFQMFRLRSGRLVEFEPFLDAGEALAAADVG